MPKVLTEGQVRTFERDGCLSPVRAMSAERTRHYRALFEDNRTGPSEAFENKRPAT